MSTTPLSDKITLLLDTTSPSLVSDFEQEFLTSQIGLVMKGLPEMEPRQKIIIDETGKVTCSLIGDPDGNAMLKACADPDTFEANYNEGINALMTGRKVLEMLIKLPNIKGVLVCSAASFNSFPIYREQANILLSSQV